jgi:hypothetical protein
LIVGGDRLVFLGDGFRQRHGNLQPGAPAALRRLRLLGGTTGPLGQLHGLIGLAFQPLADPPGLP